MSQGLPAFQICKRINAKDDQTCTLRYEKEIDLNTVDLNTLRVGELKKILTGLGGTCVGCMEKSEFIQKINRLRQKEL